MHAHNCACAICASTLAVHCRTCIRSLGRACLQVRVLQVQQGECSRNQCELMKRFWCCRVGSGSGRWRGYVILNFSCSFEWWPPGAEGHGCRIVKLMNDHFTILGEIMLPWMELHSTNRVAEFLGRSSIFTVWHMLYMTDKPWKAVNCSKFIKMQYESDCVCVCLICQK